MPSFILSLILALSNATASSQSAPNFSSSPSSRFTARINPCDPPRVGCTREYRPTQCSWNSFSVKGANPCSAKSLLYKKLCKEKVRSVRESDIQCRGTRLGELNFIDTCLAPGRHRRCPRHLRPTICHFANHASAYGLNGCLARGSLLDKLCRKEIHKIKANALKCQLTRPQS